MVRTEWGSGNSTQLQRKTVTSRERDYGSKAFSEQEKPTGRQSVRWMKTAYCLTWLSPGETLSCYHFPHLGATLPSEGKNQTVLISTEHLIHCPQTTGWKHTASKFKTYISPTQDCQILGLLSAVSKYIKAKNMFFHSSLGNVVVFIWSSAKIHTC